MDTASPFTIPLVFSLSTITLMWTFAGGNVALFWERSYVLAGVMATLAFIVGRFSSEHLKPVLQSEYWKHSSAKTAALAGTVLALPFIIVFYFLRNHQGQFEWMASYLKNLPAPHWIALLALPFVAIPLLDLFWRGLMGPQWGIKTAAFLEALIWGFAGQHFVFFIASLLSSMAIEYLIRRNHGVTASMIAKSTWTLLVLLALLFN